jgi:hypothetical protein
VNTTSTVSRHVIWALAAAALVFVLPALAAAQEPVTSFDQLNTRLKPGDKVWVTDAQGREIEGRITLLDPATLAIDAGGPRTLRAGEVRLVRNRRHDSLARGAWIGAAGGFAAAAALVYAVCTNDECTAGPAAVFAGIITAAGVGVGVAVDAAIPGAKQVVYQAPGAASASHSSWSIVPVLTPRAKGIAVSLAF